FIVEGHAGLVIEKQLGWINLVEATIWPPIVFAIEVII
ncbi:MAG: hypothetical protein ACI9U1_001773, partial [Porticoccaceae bacterium]